MSKEDMDKGLRFNEGKPRYDLVHPIAHEGMVNVITKGAKKYAPRNWEKGMKWSKVLASLKRHVAALEKGLDYDIDPNCPNCQKSTKDNWICEDHFGELHADMLQANAHFLSAYYKIYPQGDDRVIKALNTPKIGLDIDEVICDWVGGYKKFYGYDNKHEFKSWYLHFDIRGRCKDDLKEDFYMGLEPKISPEEIPFLPHCYITSRNIDQKVTEQWLYEKGFPCVPVRTVGLSESKVDVAKEMEVDIFVDDVFKNFSELNKSGIFCYLMDAPHNRRYEVGHRRIKSLKEIYV